MNRRDVVLAVLGAADGNGYSPAQLQKAVFLITKNLPGIINEGPEFNFKPYDYGPFDRTVYVEADALNLTGLAKIERFSSNGLRYYSVTEEGRETANARLAALDDGTREYVLKVSQWVRSLSFATLVKSIYQEYPEMRANSIFVG